MSFKRDADTAFGYFHRFIIQSTANFDVNAILRGMQLTIVGGIKFRVSPLLEHTSLMNL